MKTEQIDAQQEKSEKKMEWEIPEIVELGINETQSGTHGLLDGAPPWSNIS